jgi:hypothetical protein
MSITAGWKRITAAPAIAQRGRSRRAYTTSRAMAMSAITVGVFMRTRIAGSDASVAIRSAGSIAPSTAHK